MLVKKAVITAAARSQRALPLQTLIDGEGNREVAALAFSSSSRSRPAPKRLPIVVWPGDESSYAQAAGLHASSVRFIPQPEPRGYGHAIHCARSFTSADPFLHMVGDHLYVSTTAKPSAQRLVELAQKERCSVSGVQSTRESLLIALWNRRRATASRRAATCIASRRSSKSPRPLKRNSACSSPAFAPDTTSAFSASTCFTPAVMDILDRLLAKSSGRQCHARGRARRTRTPRTIPRRRRRGPALRSRRTLWPIDRAARAGAERPRPRRSAVADD